MTHFKSNKYILALIALVTTLFLPVWKAGKIPLPADTLVGMYHPFRDAYAKDFPRGYGVKNALITDPVRQQYVYRHLAISQLKSAGQLPKWNPYNFAGTPLLANIQTAVFYPGNILFWLLPFVNAWTLLVVLQPILAAIFTYYYLKNLGLEKRACFLGATSYAFSGYMIAWLTWNTIGHVALWLPLILMAKDKLIKSVSWRWIGVLVFAETSMILAGHLQSAFYIIIFTSVYLWARLWQLYRHQKQEFIKRRFLFLLTGATVLAITFVQWWPALKFVLFSAREFDLPDWRRPDWFMPWHHLIQFLAPDFFGNPVTQNYWGVWNYSEFVGYIGIIPLIFAIYAMYVRRDKKTLFFGTSLFVALFLGLPTIIGKLPYLWSIPLLTTMQPSRILLIIDFVLVVLAALGFDVFLRHATSKSRRNLQAFIPVMGMFVIVMGVIWLVIMNFQALGLSSEYLTYMSVAKRNMILPTFLVISMIAFLILHYRVRNQMFIRKGLVIVLLFVVAFDLLRFGKKYTPFVDHTLLYPNTETMRFLQQNLGDFRYMTTDRRLLPPNVNMFYRVPSVDGYDPLYLQIYADMIAAWTRNQPDTAPATFNRILTPERFEVFIADLLGVKYILSMKEEESPTLKKVFTEGETRVYENLDVFKRAFLVERVIKVMSAEEEIKLMFARQKELAHTAVTSADVYVAPQPLLPEETAEIISYGENIVTIKTNTQHERLLVLTDVYYPDWQVDIDGSKSHIFPVDYALRGVVVPEGEHLVTFRI